MRYSTPFLLTFQHTIIDSLNGDPQQAFFGVYDGHGGRDTAKFVSENLHMVLLVELVLTSVQVLLEELQKTPKETEALFNSHIRVDKLAAESVDTVSSGCTSVCALLRTKEDGRYLYVANAGDARAVLK